MTEGTCEKALLDVLLDKGLLVFGYDDLLYQQIFASRQINFKLLEMINQLSLDEKIIIIRVGDKLSDNLDISEIEDRVIECRKICIKPEFEILHTIHEGLFDAFIKQKSSVKVSSFYAEHNCLYKKTYNFNRYYFELMAKDELFETAIEYNHKRKAAHKKDELTLLSILKDN